MKPNVALFLAVFFVFALRANAMPAEGVYQSQGKSHYSNAEITVKHWAHKLKVTATLVRGQHQFPVDLTLSPAGKDRYRGNGFLTVRYPDGTGCRHRVGARIWVVGDQIYLRENTPQGIPYNPNGPCTAAGPYVWFDHQAPYQLQP